MMTVNTLIHPPNIKSIELCLYMILNWYFLESVEILQSFSKSASELLIINEYVVKNTFIWTCFFEIVHHVVTQYIWRRAVFLNRRALASIIPGHERFSWNLSF